MLVHNRGGFGSPTVDEALLDAFLGYRLHCRPGQIAKFLGDLVFPLFMQLASQRLQANVRLDLAEASISASADKPVIPKLN